MCGAVALSKVIQEERRLPAEHRDHYYGQELIADYNKLKICCALLLFVCGSTLLLEIALLTISFILKSNQVFVIVVSYHDIPYIE